MLKMSLTKKLEHWVADGGNLVGEVSVFQNGDGAYRLLHHLDHEREDLERFESPIGARSFVRYNDSGEFRPWKSAPGLRRGWELLLGSSADLREALDYIYPAVVGTWFSNQEASIDAVPLREVLGRQTGMYRFSNNLSDEGAQKLVAKACGADGGCLKRVCWPLAEGQPITSLPAEEVNRDPREAGEMPMLCVEGCNWLVAKARKASADEFQATQDK
ncbi:MAG: sirohydrochlorin cobaltochelatase [Pseudoalteromonas tetraodonis]|jgi:sirohydrochlorin cobaltochelatase